jgi:hypothetical protein
VATAYSEALSRHALETAVENEGKKLRIIVPVDKASIISSMVSDVLPGDPVCSVKDEKFFR